MGTVSPGFQPGPVNIGAAKALFAGQRKPLRAQELWPRVVQGYSWADIYGQAVISGINGWGRGGSQPGAYPISQGQRALHGGAFPVAQPE